MDGLADRRRLSLDLAKVALGDQQALKRVYAATSAKLFGVCLRILGDDGEAEDVLQDIYLTVWRRAGSFDPDRGVSPVTWLAAIARNRAIDRLRVGKAHLSRPLEAAGELADAAPLASAAVEQQQDERRLNTCLERLEPMHAAAIRSAFFDGHTYASLAEAAAVPLGTMKSWIRRALGQLRTCLQS